MTFSKVVLYTDRDGRAKWREEAVELPEGSPHAMLSKVMPSAGYQLRASPVGFRSQWHCTPQPQWVFILRGEMEIGLQDGQSRRQRPGYHVWSPLRLADGALVLVNRGRLRRKPRTVISPAGAVPSKPPRSSGIQPRFTSTVRPSCSPKGVTT